MRGAIGVWAAAAAVVTGAAGWSWAQEGAREAAPPARRVPQGPNAAQLRPYAWMIGSWKCDAQLPGRDPYAIERTCAWSLDEQYIEMRTRFDIAGVIVEERAMLGYDQEARQFKLFAFGSDGSYAVSTAFTPGADGSLIFDTRMVGGGAPGEYRVMFTPGNDDAYKTRIFARHQGDWANLVDFEYKRVK